MKKIITLALTLLASPAMAQETVTGDELEALLGPHRTVVIRGPGYTAELTLKSSGAGLGSATFDDGKVTKISGAWYISGNQFCRSWDNIDEGKEVCETWVKDGSNKVRVLVDGKEIEEISW
jgi:hypothetical protein